MKAIFISLIVIAVILVIAYVVTFLGVSAYQHASGIVEDYYDALEHPDDDAEFQAEITASYDELMNSKRPFIVLARWLYF